MSSSVIAIGPRCSCAAANTPEGCETLPAPADRMDALHRQAGALTHDLNNLLGVILSANERLAVELAGGGEQQKLALLASEAAERGGDLLRRLLDLTQDRTDDPGALAVADALQTVRRLARQSLPEAVCLDVREPASALVCQGERTGLEMALLNLCLNAGQATPDGGRVVVQTRRVSVNASSGLALRPGAYAAFTVRDNGAGMSPKTLARAMDPLFTTKPGGCGLGLSSVVDFAAAAGGALTLLSREGRGTTATLYLPLISDGLNAVAA